MLIEDYLIISKSVCAYFTAGKIPAKFCSELSDYRNRRRNTELITCHLHLQIKYHNLITNWYNWNRIRNIFKESESSLVYFPQGFRSILKAIKESWEHLCCVWKTWIWHQAAKSTADVQKIYFTICVLHLHVCDKYEWGWIFILQVEMPLHILHRRL